MKPLDAVQCDSAISNSIKSVAQTCKTPRFWWLTPVNMGIGQSFAKKIVYIANRSFAKVRIARKNKTPAQLMAL